MLTDTGGPYNTAAVENLYTTFPNTSCGRNSGVQNGECLRGSRPKAVFYRLCTRCQLPHLRTKFSERVFFHTIVPQHGTRCLRASLPYRTSQWQTSETHYFSLAFNVLFFSELRNASVFICALQNT